MKAQKLLLLLVPAVFAAVQVFGQETATNRSAGTSTDPTLSVFSATGQMSASAKGIFMGGRAISYTEAKNYLEPWPEATKYLKAGRRYAVGANVAAFAGGFMVGWGIGSALNKKVKTNTGTTIGLIAGGAAVIGGALGLSHIGVVRYKKAAQTYNDAVGAFEPSSYTTTLTMTGTPGGFGLQLTF